MAYTTPLTITPAWDPSGGTSTTKDATVSGPLVVGDLVYVYVPYVITGDTTHTVTDSLGNTYTEITTQAGVTPKYFLSGDGNTGGRHFFSVVTVAGTPSFIRATAAAACSMFGCFAEVLRGMTGTPLQATVAYARRAGVGATTDALASGSITVSTPPVALIAWARAISGSNGATLAAGTGFTSRQTGLKANGLADFVRVAHKRVTASGAQTATWTPGQAGNDWIAGAIVFSELSTDPLITGTSSATPAEGSTLTANGINLKDAGNSTATIGGTACTITTQSATAPQLTVALGTNKFGAAVNLVITTSGAIASNAYALTLAPATGHSYIDIVTPNTTATYRFTSVADVASGDQIEVDNPNVTVYNDATYSYNPLLVTSFQFRVWTAGSGYGPWGTITLGGGGAGASKVAGILATM